MKCPKCNFASFEYLNTCKKCGSDLSLHKTEMGVDFPQYNSLGLMALLRHEASPQAAVAEPASLVQDTHGAEHPFSETSGTEKFTPSSDFDSVMGESDTDFSNIGADIDLGGSEGVDLSGLGESPDETASIKSPPVEEEPINIVPEPVAAGPQLEGIDFDPSVLENTPAAPESPKTLDLGEIEESVTPGGKKEDEFNLDLGDIEITAENPKPAETGKAAPAAGGDFNMEGLDFDLNLDDIDTAAPEKKAEPKKEEEKKKDDFDIDIDLSDLKLD